MAAGYRHAATGALTYVGTEGDWWSTSSYASGNHSAGKLNFNAGNVNPLNGWYRASAYSVRCVQHLPERPATLSDPEDPNPKRPARIRSGEGHGFRQRDRRFSNPLSA